MTRQVISPGLPAPPAGTIELTLTGQTIATVDLAALEARGRLQPPLIEQAVLDVLPPEVTLRRRSARIAFRLDRPLAARRASELPRTGGRVAVPSAVVAVKINSRVVKQALRNTCESAALEILLSTAGQRVDQDDLQERLPRSGPLDPIDRNGVRTWGDPELGYVGRANGGATAGGFGVYQGPVADVARRAGVPLAELTGQEPAAVYRTLRSGRAVMVWVGLSAGPYGQWRSPNGRLVNVNFGEHTVVLTGLTRDGRLLVSNPLHGTRETWTRQEFKTMWERLDRRALTPGV